jgi:Ion channel
VVSFSRSLAYGHLNERTTAAPSSGIIKLMLEAPAVALGVLLIAIALLDAFETIVLPRRVTRQLRLARLFFRSTWRPWAALTPRMPSGSREAYLSFYGPLSLIFLIIIWAALLIAGFGLINWGLGSAVTASGAQVGFGSDIYMSGTTFFTLGLGDVSPHSSFSRVIAVVEAGAGLGFLALVITYLPVLYQAFSRREVNVSLLDARAGSPPSAGEFFHRLSASGGGEDLNAFMQEWERWAAELLEIHLSYPVLALYRSQHERQSWLASLTFILDVSSLVVAGGMEGSQRAARLTFAMARHAAVDLSQVLAATPDPSVDRLPPADFIRLIAASGDLLADVRQEQLTELRRSYEPNVAALSRFVLMPLPSWLPAEAHDAWRSSPWE